MLACLLSHVLGIVAMIGLAVIAQDDSRIPQMLLPAIHSSEVQAELKLSAVDVQWLEDQFQELDGPWWRARNLPPQEQRAVVAQQERELRSRLQLRLSPPQMQRLNELEIQAQGTRCLLRPDVVRRLALTSEQQAQLQQLVADTVTRQNEYQAALKNGTTDKELQVAVTRQQQRELTESVALLNREQQKSLQDLLGAKLDLSRAERVFPLAPEFSPDSQWIGTSPGSLADLRGKVVLIHFYAFQCINCQRNFHHYSHWGQQWAQQDVVVVGIQTPETSAERSLELVQEAAANDGFNFPVIMDAQQKNWQAWGNTMWPTVYVVDKRGYIRMWWQGELNWQGATGDAKIIELVERLLKE